MTEAVLNRTRGRVSVAPMSEHDLLEVVEIEQTTGLSRWGWNAYHAELRSENRNLMWVARLAHASRTEENESLAGYVVGRLAAGERIGTALLTRVLEEAKSANGRVAFLEVRAGNSAAQAFYERCGFRAVGRRRNYYPEPPEDALIMSRNISGEPLI